MFSIITSIFTCFCLVVVSFCLSASEVAIFSLSRLQLRFLKENFRPAYKRIKFLLGDPSGVLITILVTNEIVNVTLSIYVTELIEASQINWKSFEFIGLPHWLIQTFFGTLITTPIILLVCEISPKVIATRMNRLFAPLTVRFLYFFYQKLLFIRLLFRFLLRIFRVDNGKTTHGTPKDLTLKESDLLYLAEQAEKEGTIGEDEVRLIRKVFALDDIFVGSLVHELTPQVSLQANQTLQDAFVLIKVEKTSRIPVLSPDKTQVVGVLYTKDLINISEEKTYQSVLHFVRKPFMVKSQMQLSALFRQFKNRKTHIAIVTDDAGNLKGYITMQDILNCLFMNLFSERDLRFLRKKIYG